MMQKHDSGYLFQAGKLFQEYVLHGFVNMEHQRLMWSRQNQKHLRADTYKSIRDAVHEQNNRDPTDSLYEENEVGVSQQYFPLVTSLPLLAVKVSHCPVSFSYPTMSTTLSTANSNTWHKGTNL